MLARRAGLRAALRGVSSLPSRPHPEGGGRLSSLVPVLETRPPVSPAPTRSGPVATVGTEPACVPGDLISRLTSDTTMVSDLVSQNINIFLRNTVKVTGVVVFMFSLSWQLSLVTFMGFPIIMMVSDIYGKYYKVGPACFPLGSVSRSRGREAPQEGLGGTTGGWRRTQPERERSVHSFTVRSLIQGVRAPGCISETEKLPPSRGL